MRLLRQIHIAILAYFTKFFRIRRTLQTFRQAHSIELRETPVYNWPVTLARQSAEIDGIKAGKLDSSTAIVDRKSWAWPYMPQSVNRLNTPVLKSSPYNLRRMSRTPVPRRAMNLIKGALVAQNWAVRPIKGVDPIDSDQLQEERIKIAEKVLKHPNNQDSFQTWLEQGTEDFLILGGFVAELRLTIDPERPIKSWPVNVESVRVFPSWTESTPDMPHYAQMTGLKGERGAMLFYDDELIYIKDNPSTDNPFGLGKMEVAFSSVNYFLGIQDMSGRAGTDAVHKCFPEGTEVLTRRGWVLWRDTVESDEYATRSLDGEFQWQKALAFVKEWHDGDLIRFHSRNLNITVTPNHRMYGTQFYRMYKKKQATRISKPLGFIEATDLFDAVANRPGHGWRKGKFYQKNPSLVDFRIPTRTEWKDGVLPADTFQLGARCFRWEDWAAFLGIWMAEGSVLGAGYITPPQGEYRVQIAQSKKSNLAKYIKIERLLKRMGFKYVAKSDRFLFSDREVWAYLSPLGDSHSKRLPQWVKDAPASIISIFVKWAMMGDGSIGPRGKRIYYTASKDLAGEMQELFQKIGSSAAVNTHDKRGLGLYAVEEMLRKEVSIIPEGGRGKDRKPEKIPYSGYVYCAMVPNGTLYCREKGQAFWSGNTWLWWQAPQSDTAYQAVRRHIQNELEGQAKVSLIGGMAKPDVLEINPVTEDDLLLGWQELLIRMIANAFDMSAMALGVEHDINRAVGEVLDDKDFRSAVVPAARRLQEAFTRRILHAKLKWHDLEFVFLNLDDPDAETKLDIYTKMYSANATTPNRMCIAMGHEKLESPFADLTQAEMMIVMTQAQMDMQNSLADSSLQRQAKAQQMFQPPQQPGDTDQSEPDVHPTRQLPPGQPQKALPPGQPQGGPPQAGGGKGGGVRPGANGQPQSPKALALPKFPIVRSSAGVLYTAKQVAQLPVNQIQDVWKFSGKRVSVLMQQMDNQEPGILETLSDEVKEFFDERLKEEKKLRGGTKLSPKVLKTWMKALQKSRKFDDKRPNDYSQYLHRRAGKPGVGNATDSAGVGRPRPVGGKPGNINPIQRG